MSNMIATHAERGAGVTSDTPISVVLAPTVELAESFSSVYSPEYTIECEYGATVIEGTVFTGAHHQTQGKYARDANPSPCNNRWIPPAEPNSTFLVSHVDLDTIGGIMRSLKEYLSLFGDKNKSFWAFAEFIDLNGSHKMNYFPGFQGMSENEINNLKNFLYAFYGWRKNNKLKLNREEVNIITPFFRRAAKAIGQILDNNPDYIETGKTLQVENLQLNVDSFWFSREIPQAKECDPFRVFFRKSSAPVSFMYTHPRDETTADAIVAWNQASGAITLSYQDDISVNLLGPASDVMQTIWGSKAGGHPGCAGTPRGVYYEAQEVDKIYSELVYRLSVLSTETGVIPF